MRLLITHTGRNLERIESAVPELLLAQKCGHALLFPRCLNTGGWCHQCHAVLDIQLSLKIGIYRNRYLRKSCDICVTSLCVFDVSDSLRLVMSSELLSIAYIEHSSALTYNPV